MPQVGSPPPPPDRPKPEFWRSLAELEGSPEFREFLEREFATPLENQPPDSPERRRFLELMGASFALAGVATGCRWEREKILPQTRRPQPLNPGESRQFASAMDVGGAAVGVLVTSYEGRPIKVEGNPLHPSSGGATSALQQASILGLYDPDRSTSVVRREGSRAPATWSDFDAFARKHFAALSASRGRGLRVLAERSSSLALTELRARLLAAHPEARWVEWEPVNRDNERAGARLAFGAPLRAQLIPEKANVIACLDADLFVEHPAGPGNGRRLSARRAPERGMNRLFVVESSYTPTGVMADHRLALRSEQIAALACALDATISAKAQPLPEHGPAQDAPRAAFLAEPGVARFVTALADDLLANVGASLVVVGPGQPPEVHAIAHRLNTLLGNVGRTLEYTEEPDGDRPADMDALRRLVDEMRRGEVDTLLILGGNPAYTAPADIPFAGSLPQVKTSIHLSLYEDETSELVRWHLPQAHWLEAWSDARAWDGTVSIVQPLIAPLHGGRSALELVATLVGEAAPALDLVQRAHQARLGDPRLLRRALHDGVVPDSRLAAATPTLQPLPRVKLGPGALGGMDAPNGALELTFAADAKVYDGRFGNNAWLQELPEPFSKLTWDNAALIAPSTAQALGIDDGSLVVLRVGDAELTMLALHAPGQARGSVRVTLGYGRTAAGVVGGSRAAAVDPVGVDVNRLRTSARPWISGGLTLTPTGRSHNVATTQHLHAIDGTGKAGEAERLPALVREATLEEWKHHPEFPKHAVHHPPLLNLWRDPVAYDGRKWGMSIDLNKCMGCSACVVACQAENNVPVVGKESVLKGREMHWLRIDRYYRGEPDEAEVSCQPLPCQHCENAPCEQVCPVGATVHSSEGLNDMVYNRCIGTRYCSNNCPYKVRRFNYFNFNLDYEDPKNQPQRLALNPEVTVRARGVMEKCTFCVQRIQNVKIKAKNARRGVKDGEVTTACAQACPTQAIVFGDLNERESRVSAESGLPRAYALLGENNTRPRVAYQARVRNRHPALGGPAHGHEPQAHGQAKSPGEHAPATGQSPGAQEPSGHQEHH